MVFLTSKDVSWMGQVCWIQVFSPGPKTRGAGNCPPRLQRNDGPIHLGCTHPLTAWIMKVARICFLVWYGFGFMISHLGWELLNIFILLVGILSFIWILAIWRWDGKAITRRLGNSCSAVFGLVICNWNILDLRLPNISVLYSILVVEFNQVKHIHAFWTQTASPKRPKRCCFFVQCKLKN